MCSGGRKPAGTDSNHRRDSQDLTVGCIRHKSDIARSLDSHRQVSLVSGAVAGNPTRQNFAPFGDVFLELVWIFIVDQFDFVGAEIARFASAGRSTAVAVTYHDLLS